MRFVELVALDDSPAFVNPETVIRVTGTSAGTRLEFLNGAEGFYKGNLVDIVTLLTGPQPAPPPPKYLARG